MSKKNECKLINVTAKSLLNGLFDGKLQYIIPDNQRLYAWEKEQYEDFLNDLKKIGETGEHHFLNQITFIQDDKKRYLYDGQQRTTTIMLHMLYTVSQVLNSEEDENIKKYKKYLFIENGDSRFISGSLNKKLIECIFNKIKNNEKIFIKNNESNNWDIDDDIISLVNNSSSNKRIIEYLRYIDDRYDKECNSPLNKIETIKKDANNLLNKMEVILVRIKEEKEGFKIFELVNNRGKGLDNIDLIKNKIFQIAYEIENKKTGDDIRNMWGDLITTYNDDFNEFFRIFVSVNYFNVEGNDTRGGKSLYQSFEKSLPALKKDQGDHIHDILSNMKDASKINFDLVNKSEFYLGKNYNEIDKMSREVNIGISDFQKILLHLNYSSNLKYYKYYVYKMLFEKEKNKKEIDIDQIEGIYDFYQRNNLFGTGDNSKTLKKINSKLYEVVNSENILEELKKHEKDNDLTFDVLKTFESKKVTGDMLKATLFMLEKKISEDYSGFLYDSDRITVKKEEEHFVPKDAIKDDSVNEWGIKQADSNVIKFHDYIGNKILLDKKTNIDVSKEGPNSKITKYIALKDKDQQLRSFLKIIADNVDNIGYKSDTKAILELQTKENINLTEAQIIEIYSKWQKYIAEKIM